MTNMDGGDRGDRFFSARAVVGIFGVVIRYIGALDRYLAHIIVGRESYEGVGELR